MSDFLTRLVMRNTMGNQSQTGFVSLVRPRTGSRFENKSDFINKVYPSEGADDIAVDAYEHTGKSEYDGLKPETQLHEPLERSAATDKPVVMQARPGESAVNQRRELPPHSDPLPGDIRSTIKLDKTTSHQMRPGESTVNQSRELPARNGPLFADARSAVKHDDTTLHQPPLSEQSKNYTADDVVSTGPERDTFTPASMPETSMFISTSAGSDVRLHMPEAKEYVGEKGLEKKFSQSTVFVKSSKNSEQVLSESNRREVDRFSAGLDKHKLAEPLRLDSESGKYKRTLQISTPILHRGSSMQQESVRDAAMTVLAENSDQQMQEKNDVMQFSRHSKEDVSTNTRLKPHYKNTHIHETRGQQAADDGRGDVLDAPMLMPRGRVNKDNVGGSALNAQISSVRHEVPSQTSVKVSIGRIEIRATTPPPVPTASVQRPRRGPAISLDTYLKKGKGGLQ